VKIASREALQNAVETVFKKHPKAVKDALTDENAVHYLVGQLMRETKGKADPRLANQMIQEKLESIKTQETS
jgi:aspartyl-tRNA(Asn)/glutamyl-tRNA(Gln) amidotransferase subunit B